jgi:nitrogen fixation NifU-like protein
MDNEMRREIIMDNYMYPYNKEVPKDLDDYIKVNTNNESCIDNIDLYVKIEENKISDMKFMGEACAISTSATSIMIRTLIGKSLEEAIKIAQNYENMINEEEYDANILEQNIVYDEIYKQQNRKHCAMLPWNGLKKALEKYQTSLKS